MDFHHGLYDWVAERIRRGMFHGNAVSGLNRTVQKGSREEADQLIRANPLRRPAVKGRLRVRPTSLSQANAFVNIWHRHHVGSHFHRFSLEVFDAAGVRGVAIVGNPKSRVLDNGEILEIVRVATDGAMHACSKLLGAVCREARRRGYKKVITYTLPEEGGGSLRGAGFSCAGETRGGSWDQPSRPRRDKHPTCKKLRWERDLSR